MSGKAFFVLPTLTRKRLRRKAGVTTPLQVGLLGWKQLSKFPSSSRASWALLFHMQFTFQLHSCGHQNAECFVIRYGWLDHFGPLCWLFCHSLAGRLAHTGNLLSEKMARGIWKDEPWILKWPSTGNTPIWTYFPPFKVYAKTTLQIHIRFSDRVRLLFTRAAKCKPTVPREKQFKSHTSKGFFRAQDSNVVWNLRHPPTGDRTRCASHAKTQKQQLQHQFWGKKGYMAASPGSLAVNPKPAVHTLTQAGSSPPGPIACCLRTVPNCEIKALCFSHWRPKRGACSSMDFGTKPSSWPSPTQAQQTPFLLI